MDETSQVPRKERLHVLKVSDCARFFSCKPFVMRRCCLLFNGTRSAPRNWTRFAAQYLARGLPCERFTSALAGRRASLGDGAVGYSLPREGLAPPNSLPACPGALRSGSFASILAYPRHFRFAPASDRTADVPGSPQGALTSFGATQKNSGLCRLRRAILSRYSPLDPARSIERERASHQIGLRCRCL
jgi:hypothetical protein